LEEPSGPDATLEIDVQELAEQWDYTVDGQTLDLCDGQLTTALDAALEGISRRLKGGDPAEGADYSNDEVGEILKLVQKVWGELVWLPAIDDAKLGEAVAAAVVSILLEQSGTTDQPGRLKPEIRAGKHALPSKRQEMLRRRLEDLDKVIGATQAAAAARVNVLARQSWAPGFASFLGDVLVYQRHQERIHQRVRELIAADNPRPGAIRTTPMAPSSRVCMWAKCWQTLPVVHECRRTPPDQICLLTCSLPDLKIVLNKRDSDAGRPWHGGGQRFESPQIHCNASPKRAGSVNQACLFVPVAGAVVSGWLWGLLVAAGVGGVRLERPEPVTQERARTYELDADEPAGILGCGEPPGRPKERPRWVSCEPRLRGGGARALVSLSPAKRLGPPRDPLLPGPPAPPCHSAGAGRWSGTSRP
jgi:hypothetical protein